MFPGHRLIDLSVPLEHLAASEPLPADLDRLPRPHGFWVSCLPVKIRAASAGRCRAVAVVPEG